MTAILEPLQIHEFGSNLQEYDLDFEQLVIHSRTTTFNKFVDDSGLSIKMTVKGEENFIINNQKYTVSPGKYLLINKHQQFECQLDSDEEIEGLCIYLKMDLVREVFEYLNKSNKVLLDSPHHLSVNNLTFLEKLYMLSENELGHYLQQFVHGFKTNSNVLPQSDIFYYTLAERLLISQMKINRQINQIQSSKYSTREELFLRLSECRNYIFDNYTKPIQLDDLARVALLSKYHLLRTYKQVFNITPYQQVLQLRLEHAKKLVVKDYALEEIAFQLGFSDRRSFTKAFKKAFSISPTGFRQFSRIN